ncbi:MAG: hypothetical protein CMO80_21650 [Verrucomicrobiales bacterium]|nr:hypothetical protein [Verrucomicrobiales bacterium]
MVGAAQAGCGKKVTVNGTLKAVDTAKKQITVQVAGKKKPARLKLTPKVKVGDLQKLKGKAVTVIHEHNKVESVKAKKA